MSKKTSLFIIAFIWIVALIILIISLTDLYQDTIFKDYRLIIGISFLVITKILDNIYHFVTENDKRT